MTSFAKLRRKRPILVTAWAIALTLTFLFGLRTIGYLNDWRHTSEIDVEGWMTPRYIAHANRVDPQTIIDSIDLDRDQIARRTLAQIARQQNVPLDELIAQIEAAIAAQKQGADE